jgi:trimethylamine--corrinoid protein Co-methyltransferase
MTVDRKLKSNYKANRSVQFQVLSEDQCEEILFAAFEVLERTGVEIHSEEALSLLEENGCWVEEKRVKVPSYLIKKALNTVPSRVVLCDRDGNREVFLEGNNSYFGPGPTNPYFIDLETGERRGVTKQDIANTAKMCDKLPNIDFVMSLAGLDNPSELADVHEVHAMLQNTTKPIVSWGIDAAGCKDTINMCSAVAGGLEELQQNPFIALYAGDPVSPLKHPKDSLEKLLFLTEKGIPVIYPSGMLLGGTAPVTIAGALVEGLADNLVALLLSQLKREGAPFIIGIGMALMDMSTTITSYGAPEFNLGYAAGVDLGHYLNLPTFGTAGATDSKVVDQQAAIEATMSCYSSALSGANLIHDIGFMESGMSASLEHLVMGDEIIGMVRRFISGVKVNKETLAVDVLDKVGPGGHFLNTDHTRNHFKEETWFPTVMDRQEYSAWEMQGKKTMKERLNRKAKDILAEHEPKPLSSEIKKKIDGILERAEKRIAK